MAAYRYELACPDDEAALRRILHATVMPGEIALSFEREPCFFTASALEGLFHQTLVARAADGTVIATGSRAVRPCFVNGAALPVGYMSLLRVAPDARLGGALSKVLARGFDLYHELHRDGRTLFYLVSVMEGNRAAERLLTAGLVGWPTLRPWARLVTHCIAIGRPRRLPPLSDGLRLMQGRTDLLPEIAACLQRAGTQRQLMPVWKVDDLMDMAALDLDASSLWVVRCAGRVVGCAARWNQRRFKQTVVRGYGRRLAALRPWINAAGWVLGRPPLPPVGAQVRFAFLSHLAVDGDDPQVGAALIAAVYNAAATAGDHYLMLGLAADDPRRAWLDRYVTVDLPSRLYLASWEDGHAAAAAVDGRCPGVEIAVL
jgi:hypothetical protein